MNGRDVSQCSHEEAVEAFLQAQEPITVEVLRSSAASASTGGGSNSRPSKTATETASSVPSSHRNSVYIPTTKSPSQTSLKEPLMQPTLINDNNLEAGLSEDVLNTEEMDEVNFAVLPGLDYEVNIFGRIGN